MRTKNPNGIKRKNQICLFLSDEEIGALNKYVLRYKAKSRSAVIREGIMRFVVGRFIEDDYPSLFEENELKKMIEKYSGE